MEDEYSSDINTFIGNNNQIPPHTPQIYNPQIPPIYNPQIPQIQQQQSQIYNPQLETIQQQQQQYQYPQPTMNTDYRYFKPMENFSFKFNTKENILSVIVIVILFMLFASHNFRKVVSGLSFLNMVNSDYNLTSLFIVGLIFAIIYNALKLFMF